MEEKRPVSGELRDINCIDKTRKTGQICGDTIIVCHSQPAGCHVRYIFAMLSCFAAFTFITTSVPASLYNLSCVGNFIVLYQHHLL